MSQLSGTQFTVGFQNIVSKIILSGSAIRLVVCFSLAIIFFFFPYFFIQFIQGRNNPGFKNVFLPFWNDTYSVGWKGKFCFPFIFGRFLFSIIIILFFCLFGLCFYFFQIINAYAKRVQGLAKTTRHFTTVPLGNQSRKQGSITHVRNRKFFNVTGPELVGFSININHHFTGGFVPEPRANVPTHV